MNRQKAAVLTIGAVVIAGIIAFQVRPAIRTAPPPAASQGPESSQASSNPVVSRPSPVTPAVRTPIPASGWGRNPFLTPEEIAALDAPAEAAAVITLPPPAIEAPAPLPQHELTGIVSNDEGSVAVINSRVVRVGDRIGEETVKEIRLRSVILESKDGIREILLKPIQADGVQRANPREELQ